MLLSSSLSFSQSVTNSSDSLIYTPQYLFELMVADLEQCDLDRIELKKAKAELAVIYVDLAKVNNSKQMLSEQLKELRNYNDSLVTNNMNTPGVRCLGYARHDYMKACLVGIVQYRITETMNSNRTA